MRKTRVIGLVVASLVSAASFAQAQTATPSARHERRAEARGGEARVGRGLFRGITLSDAEKARVKQVHEKFGAEAKTLRESMRPALQDARAARQKGDTAAARAALSRTSGEREKLRALVDRQTAEIRSALTPEHQRVFDTNAKQLEQRRAEMKKNGKGDRRGRGAFRGGRGGRSI